MIKKAYSISDIDKRVFKTIPLQDEWLRHLGKIEQSGSILVMGDSGHGKTSYMLQMAKAFCEDQRVMYDSAEEGMRESFRRSLHLNNMHSVANKFSFVKERYDDLFKRLSMKRQPKIVIIDSIQYCFRGKRAKDYYKLIETFSNTLFIGLSHVDANGAVKGSVANEFYWDCQNRIKVQDFKAYVDKSRCGGDEVNPLIINAEKAKERELRMVNKG